MLTATSGAIDVYVAKDYSGHMLFSHRIVPLEQDTTVSSSKQHVTQLMYSPDGYVLFVATDAGWFLWSVYGHLLASSLPSDRAAQSTPLTNGLTTPEGYMGGVTDCCWMLSGLHVILLGSGTRTLYSLPFCRSAATTCYNPVTKVCILCLTIGHNCTTAVANRR